MEKRKDKKQIVIGITILLLVTLILLGLTYAYYRTKVIGNSANKSISATSKNLEVTYQDDTSLLSGEIDTTKETNEFTKNFSVKNTGGGEGEYSIKITDVTDTFVRTKDWTYEIKKANDTTSSEAPSNYETPVKSGTLPNTDSYLVFKEKVGKGETNYYQFILKYDYSETENQSVDMGKQLSFKIDIDNVVGDIFTNEKAGETTLLKAIGDNNPIAIKTLTEPGQKPSASNEGELAMTEDDYGTSYYFRGEVDNNFVTMGNTCWMIVRVQGDGSIKITLYDEKQSCNNSVPDGTGAFISFDGEKLKSHFGNTYDKNTVKFGSSAVQSALEDWYGPLFDVDGSLTEYSNLIEEAEWCNDVSKREDSGTTFFGAYDRLYTPSTAKPSLRCRTLEGYSDGSIYLGHVALLTADEVAFAGSSYYSSGVSWDYYLQENATGNFYWTLSPFWSDAAPVVWGVNTTGYLDSTSTDQSEAVRPTLILNSDVPIAEGGNGTKTSPYVISTN